MYDSYIKWGLKLLYAGFETCFGWDPPPPRHQRCWDPKQNTSRIQMLRHFCIYNEGCVPEA